MTPAVGRRTFLSHFAAAGLAAGVPLRWDPFASVNPTVGGVFLPKAEEPDAKIFAAARRQLLFAPSITFCNTGTLGACPREVVDAAIQAYRTVEQELPDWPYRPKPTDVPPMSGYLPLPQFREEAGALVNASIDEVALTQNATMAMSFLANGLELERGDEILTTDQEHPGGISPWLLRQQRHGIVVRPVKLLPLLEGGPEGLVAAFAENITQRTRVLMFSHITSTLGIKLPARELCALARDRGLLAIVDGAQAVGQMRVDVRDLGCDAYVTSTHKWLLAPKGTGLLYMKRPLQDQLWPTLVTADFDKRELAAFRFMHFGTGPMSSVHGLSAAVRFMTRLGIDRVERWDAMLTKRLRDGLKRMSHVRLSSPTDDRFASAMTTFAIGGRTSDQVQDELWKHKIRVRAQGQHGVRLSAHFYVAPRDIDRVLEIVDSMAA